MKFLKRNHTVAVMLSALFLTSIFYSCQNEELIDGGLDQSQLSEEDLMAGPDLREGELVTIQFNGEPLEVLKIGEVFYNADMMVTPDSEVESNTGLKSNGNTKRLWPNSTVHYAIASDLPNKTRVTGAIAHWESKTNLKFVKRTNQNAYVEFIPATGVCSSFIGRTGAKQAIKLSTGCTLGTTIHEIGHAIGLYHEQSRSDRDNYLTVNFGNIQDGKSHNFNKWGPNSGGKNLTATLDFGSIMMYSSKAFSKNGKPTIVKKNGGSYTTNRTALSADDIKGINILYPAQSTGGNTGGGPAGFTFAANEGGTVTVSSGKIDIAYGANGKFKYKKNVSSNTKCNNATFGDPINGVVKKCYKKVVSTTTPTPTPPTTGNCAKLPTFKQSFKNTGQLYKANNKIYKYVNKKRRYVGKCN